MHKLSAKYNRLAMALPLHWRIVLVGILLLGLGLRFWQLDSKPLWLDEVISSLFSLGRSYGDVPVETAFAPDVLNQLFTYQSGQSCAQIAARVTVESVHPPLFFCLMYRWMGWLTPIADSWVWALRSLPALFGVGAIAAMYWLNRVAFSPTAGLVGAALMAVSPFAVYLSQEARHYTLPMLLITLALSALAQIQQRFQRRQSTLWLWLGWAGLNLLGLYVHYFCSLALVAQIGAIALWFCLSGVNRQNWIQLTGAIALIGIGYLPWLPTMLRHLNRPETDWLKPFDPSWPDRLAPLYQTLIGWVLMVVALPVEGQPLWVAIPSVAGMLAFSVWLGWQVWRGLRDRWRDPNECPSLVLLGGFTLGILSLFAVIVYGLDKDLTAVPRYNFIYYPGVCALLGAAVTSPKVKSTVWRNTLLVLTVGAISSVIVVHNLAFQKSYSPDKVAQTIYAERDRSVLVAVSYRSLQETALGLSFALALQNLDEELGSPIPLRYAFLSSETGDNAIWRSLSTLEPDLSLPLNLWVVATPSVKLRNFPESLRVVNRDRPTRRGRGVCTLDPNEVHRIGFPYRLYRCKFPN